MMDKKLVEKKKWIDTANRVVSQLSNETLRDEFTFISLVYETKLLDFPYLKITYFSVLRLN
jgi:hypothetical protein